jgi:hypothetical protein
MAQTSLCFVGVRAARDHGRQRLRNDDDKGNVHDQEQDDRGHAEEMDHARRVEAPQQPGQLLELCGLPDRQAGENHDHARGQHPEIERLLHRVINSEPMRQPELQRRQSVAQHGFGSDREQDAAEMPRENSIREIDAAIDREQPHAGEMPLQGAGKPVLVVNVDRAFVAAPERDLDRERKRQDRIGIVDAPAAHDHDDHGDRVEPVRDPHGQGMDDDLRHVVQMSGGHVGHPHLPALASISSVDCSPADLSAAFAPADRRKVMKGRVSLAGSRACATT